MERGDKHVFGVSVAGPSLSVSKAHLHLEKGHKDIHLQLTGQKAPSFMRGSVSIVRSRHDTPPIHLPVYQVP